MGVGVVLVVAGVAVALSSFDGDALYAHRPLGIVILLAVCMQPFPALLCRPEPKSPLRFVFNVSHIGAGVTLF
eukprot:gene58024-biopygen59579